MILTEQQITDIIIKNPNKSLIDSAREYNKMMRMHLYGEKIETELTTIEGYEKENMRSLRVKYARSNKDLCSRLARPIDKVFSAKGGSIYYNLGDAEDKRARQISSDIRSGYSIKQWLQDSWRLHYLDDPNGVIFMEILPAQQAQINRRKGKSFVYPVYVSSCNIYDYQPNGVNLEYIVFETEKSERVELGYKEDDDIYRIVDDANDYYVIRVDENVRIITELTLPNLFLSVPAILNSDIPDPNMTGKMLSFFDEVLEMANHYLVKGSIKVTHDFLHGFPKYSEFADDCPECSGSRYSGAEKCGSCGGTGKKIMIRVSDAKLLTWPTKDEQVILPKDVGGYISPDKTFWEISTEDLKVLEAMMQYTLWGASDQPQTTGMAATQQGGQKTATEIMTELKPQSDRLYPITESAEKRHKFILDAAVQIQINQNYPGSTVNYGKRYMLESPDVLWEKYVKAKTAGAATSALDDLLVEYYETKYDSDPVKLAIQLKLMRVEPFVHLTTLQLKALSPGEDDYKAKLYFGEWLSTLNEAMILSFSIDVLKEQLTTFAAGKEIQQEQQQKPPIAA